MYRYSVNTNDTRRALQVNRQDEKTEAGMLDRDSEARRERLALARLEAGFESAAHAAEVTGLPDSTWRSHENGNRKLTKNAVHKYAAALGVRFDWLWTGNGEMKDAAKEPLRPDVALEPRPLSEAWRRMPFHGRVYGAEEGGILINDQTSETVDCPKGLEKVENAYGLEVVGESMVPRYCPGEIVHVHPTRAVHKGSHVVVQIELECGERAGFIKRFVRQDDVIVVVEQLNPPKEITYPKSRVKAVHLIVGTAIR